MADKTIRATCWSLTINNPTAADEEAINLARQKSGWKVHGQKEKGESGTEHYQLMLTTPQVRFSAIKKIFPRAHIEVARDRVALSKYVAKEDTRVGTLCDDQEHYPSMQRLWDMFAAWINERDLHHKWMDSNSDYRLELFDKYINDMIYEGYVVETMGVNPQIRSAVKNYGVNIIIRSLRRQTDRQTEASAEVEENFLE